MSNVRSVPLENGEARKAPPTVTWNQALAILLWLLGCATTYQVVAILMDSAGWGAILATSVVSQVVLTALEGPTLRGKPNPISGTFLAADTLINAGGVYLLLVDRLEKLPTARMAADVVGASPDLSPLTVAAVSFIVGAVLAATPEAVWRWKA